MPDRSAACSASGFASLRRFEAVAKNCGGELNMLAEVREMVAGHKEDLEAAAGEVAPNAPGFAAFVLLA